MSQVFSLLSCSHQLCPRTVSLWLCSLQLLKQSNYKNKKKDTRAGHPNVLSFCWSRLTVWLVGHRYPPKKKTTTTKTHTHTQKKNPSSRPLSRVVVDVKQHCVLSVIQRAGTRPPVEWPLLCSENVKSKLPAFHEWVPSKGNVCAKNPLFKPQEHGLTWSQDISSASGYKSDPSLKKFRTIRSTKLKKKKKTREKKEEG